MTHGQGMFVAVGNAGTILTSADGMDWWPEFSGIETALNGVAYGNGLFVTVGTAGTILTSEDGLMWTEQISGSANVLEAVSYGNGVFVAVGGNGVLTSSDGTTWSQREPLRLNGIAFGNGMFVGVSRHHLCDCPGQGTLDIGFVVASADGITWTPPQITGRELSKVGFGNGTFVAVGGSCGFCGFGGGCGNILLSSTDGTNWISRPAPTTEFLQGVAFGQGTFVAVGANGVIIQSGSFTPGELSGPRALGGGEMQLSVAGEIGRTYRLQTTTNLSPPGWTDLHSFTLSAPTTNLVDATSGNFTSRFYRLVSP